MAAVGGVSYKQINQGMHGLARAGSYASAPHDLSFCPHGHFLEVPPSWIQTTLKEDLLPPNSAGHPTSLQLYKRCLSHLL